jgi:hypothetical protein
MKLIYWLWFPKKDYSIIAALILIATLYPSIALLPRFIGLHLNRIVYWGLLFFPVILSAVITIRYGQTCSISQKIRSNYSTITLKKQGRKAAIVLFIIILSLAAINISLNILSWSLLNLLLIISVAHLIITFFSQQYFLILGLLITILFLLVAWFSGMLPITTVFLIAIFGVSMSISRIILSKRIREEDQRKK